MCDPILVTLLKNVTPNPINQSSREHATPSSGTSPLASHKEVPPPPPPAQRQNSELEEKLFELRKELRRSISEYKPHWKDNLTSQDRAELRELKSNRTVRGLPTDKNLGPALMSTDCGLNIYTMKLHMPRSLSRTGMLTMKM